MFHVSWHSLDRLEVAEAAHWETVRAAVLPEPTPPALGCAADETKTFGTLLAAANHTATTTTGNAAAGGATDAFSSMAAAAQQHGAAPPTMTLAAYWEKYGNRVLETQHDFASSSSSQQQQQQPAPGDDDDDDDTKSLHGSTMLSSPTPSRRWGAATTPGALGRSSDDCSMDLSMSSSSISFASPTSRTG